MGATGKTLRFFAAALLCVFLLGSCASDSTNSPSEGSVSDPLDVGSAPVQDSGSVGQAADSYYFSDAEADSWLVLLSNIDGSADLFVYDDAAFSSFVCKSKNPDSEPDSCVMTCVETCRIYMRVTSLEDSGGSFNISIAAETVPVAARGDAPATR